MKFSKLTAALAASAALSFSGAAMSATITNTDGNLSPFAGFDWASGGAAWTTGLVAAEACLAGAGPVGCATDFTINYAAWAVSLVNPGGGTLTANGLDTNPNGVLGAGKKYEYTIVASMTGTLSMDLGVGLLYSVGPGSFTIYYDTSGNANLNAGNWTGFDNGISIIEGTLDSVGTQFFSFVSPTSALKLAGVVTNTNTDYVNPVLIGHTVDSTLQLFNPPPAPPIQGFTAPKTFNGVAIDAVGEAVFQADANQIFSHAVPEPTSILLAGLALAGIGAASRRRKV